MASISLWPNYRRKLAGSQCTYNNDGRGWDLGTMKLATGSDVNISLLADSVLLQQEYILGVFAHCPLPLRDVPSWSRPSLCPTRNLRPMFFPIPVKIQLLLGL